MLDKINFPLLFTNPLSVSFKDSAFRYGSDIGYRVIVDNN